MLGQKMPEELFRATYFHNSSIMEVQTYTYALLICLSDEYTSKSDFYLSPDNPPHYNL